MSKWDFKRFVSEENRILQQLSVWHRHPKLISWELHDPRIQTWSSLTQTLEARPVALNQQIFLNLHQVLLMECLMIHLSHNVFLSGRNQMDRENT